MSGFTLLETIITVGILAALTGLVTASWPRFREGQNLLLAREQVQSLLRQAQQQALNKERSEECIRLANRDPGSIKRCSDIGVALLGNRARVFADTSGAENQYTPSDFFLEEHTLPAAVNADSTGWQSFLFKSSPPLVELYDPLGKRIETDHSVFLLLRAGRTERKLFISPYGQLQD